MDNIVKTLYEILRAYPGGGMKTLSMDAAEFTPGAAALLSTGDTRIKRDITGGERRRHTFLFYVHFSSVNDYERMTNEGFFLDLCAYLEKTAPGIPVFYDNRAGKITDVSASNGMLFEIPNGLQSSVRYQMQITAEYKIYGEE